MKNTEIFDLTTYRLELYNSIKFSGGNLTYFDLTVQGVNTKKMEHGWIDQILFFYIQKHLKTFYTPLTIFGKSCPHVERYLDKLGQESKMCDKKFWKKMSHSLDELNLEEIENNCMRMSSIILKRLYMK